MTTSPYAGKPESTWLAITQQLIDNHPLQETILLEAVSASWNTLWQSTVGTAALSVKLADLRVPATIVGYFFEVLLARELERRAPALWRGSQSKDEKDLVYIPDTRFSVEIKTSGQAGFKIYGNRSYGQKSENDLLVKKEKSGFYLTINFFSRTLTLIRFGWIDAEDWEPQAAPGGVPFVLRALSFRGKTHTYGQAFTQVSPSFFERATEVGHHPFSRLADNRRSKSRTLRRSDKAYPTEP